MGLCGGGGQRRGGALGLVAIDPNRPQPTQHVDVLHRVLGSAELDGQNALGLIRLASQPGDAPADPVQVDLDVAELASRGEQPPGMTGRGIQCPAGALQVRLAEVDIAEFGDLFGKGCSQPRPRVTVRAARQGLGPTQLGNRPTGIAMRITPQR
jgi:hypothetical protein